MWCRHCNLLFWSFDDLIKHMRSHLVTKIFCHYWRNCVKTDDNDIKCYQCSKKFSSVSDLQRHIDTVHYEESYDCEICGVKFSRSDNLARHKMLKHPEPEVSKHACKECGKQFSRSDKLKRHATVVHSGRSLQLFQCETCGKKFNREDNFARHIGNIFHTDGSPRNTCIHCRKQFCTEILLKAHRNLCQCKDDSEYTVQHRKLEHEDRLECDLCNSIFKSRFALERHENEVFSNGSPRYECQQCADYFCNGKQLKNHISNNISLTFVNSVTNGFQSKVI